MNKLRLAEEMRIDQGKDGKIMLVEQARMVHTLLLLLLLTMMMSMMVLTMTDDYCHYPSSYL
jgi:hypothetical protein